jgi:hypothetical protein
MKALNVLSELPDVCTKQTALFNAKLDPLEFIRNVNQHSYRSMPTLCHINVFPPVEIHVLFQKPSIVEGHHRTWTMNEVEIRYTLHTLLCIQWLQYNYRYGIFYNK